MPVSPAYRALIVQQIGGLVPLTDKAMFGGVSLYADGVIFALIADDTLYFKVDDSNRADYEAAGMEAFHPYGDSYAMQYYQVPPAVLDDPDTLAAWIARAVAVSRNKRRKSAPKTPRQSP